MSSDWPKYQNFLKQVNLSKEFSKKKEIEIKKEIYSKLELYYKKKIKSELLTDRNLFFLGLNTNKNTKKEKLKIEVTFDDERLTFYSSVKKYLFEFRYNFKLLEKFIADLSLEEEKQVAKIFANYFFEDLSSCSMSIRNFVSHFFNLHVQTISDFIDEDIFLSKKTFLGRFLYEIANRSEVKIYLNQVLKAFILDVDNFNFNCKDNNYLSMDYKKISLLLYQKQLTYRSDFGNNFEIIDKNFRNLNQPTNTTNNNPQKNIFMGPTSRLSKRMDRTTTFSNKGEDKSISDSINSQKVFGYSGQNNSLRMTMSIKRNNNLSLDEPKLND
ncbi:MAG: hypothetical protein MJ252_16350, partial [archaeon]|nr:hypothetical protein [archaeon]